MFLKLLHEDKAFLNLKKTLQKNKMVLADNLDGGAKSFYLWGLSKFLERNILIVTPGPLEAQNLFEALVQYDGESVLHFPAQEVLPHEKIPADISLRRERQTVLEAFSFADNKYIVVTCIQALLQGIIPPAIYSEGKIELKKGMSLDLAALSRRLVDLGYDRVPQVENWGQYSLRGGIIDIFPTTGQKPLRAELFGDEIESLRSFDIATQRSLKQLEVGLVTPALESFFPRSQIGAARRAIMDDYIKAKGRLAEMGQIKEAKDLGDRISADLELLKEGAIVDSIGQYLPYIYGGMSSLLAYAKDSLVVFDMPRFVAARGKNFMMESAETYVSLLEQGNILPGYKACFLDLTGIITDLKDHSVLLTTQAPPEEWGMTLDRRVDTPCEPVHSFHGRLDTFGEQIKKELAEGGTVVVSLNSNAKCRKMSEYLQEKKIEFVIHNQKSAVLIPGLVNFFIATIREGFYLKEAGLFVHTEEEILGRQDARKKKVQNLHEGVHISSVHELDPGDYVVHETHGIGKYLGIRTEEVLGIHQDYLIVKYAGGDRLLVPTHQVKLIQKYIGGEENPPRLYRLGGGDWNRVKKRVKESLQEMAFGLLSLYAEREAMQGFAFSADTVWQKEFEDAFPYEETPDQQRAIEEIKSDMEKSRSMDRLLCGDVGYGKTEVAIRASFKAVMDGKQVALLVPTTILAQQHYNTFLERFDGYPINIDMLSRFRSPGQQKKILQRLKSGGIDIIIGTHRLLSQDLFFYDLGLLIVDEEQRFGVAHKERIKAIKKNVDVLTLTATPIPRTLHMSMVGIRDMSIIETPPQDRYPIRTYVREYSSDLVREALSREMARGGQVYFVHNRVENIREKADEIARLVPSASIAVAHGQMPEGELEKVMLDFLEKKYDILLCTTIIETGMDIPNVNTIIINNADKMGLAQLYQLRGRVGRSNRVAYAFLLYKEGKVLSNIGEKRLMAIREFTSLGSGFKLAMRDLEIRGAGNILGPEQHGHIMAVGFSLYCKLLEESVQELMGQKKPEKAVDTVIDTSWDAYIPNEFIADTGQKIGIYKKVARIKTKKDQIDLLEEIVDRFGEPPLPVRNLLDITRLRLLAQEKGLRELRINNERGQMVLANGGPFLADKLLVLGSKYSERLQIKGSRYPKINLNFAGMTENEIRQTVEDILVFL